MHSRIIELSKDAILKHERMCESSVPDWFYHSIADYTDADTDRDHDIKWFLDAVARVVDVAEDGKSFTFKPVSYTHLDGDKRQHPVQLRSPRSMRLRCGPCSHTPSW